MDAASTSDLDAATLTAMQMATNATVRLYVIGTTTLRKNGQKTLAVSPSDARAKSMLGQAALRLTFGPTSSRSNCAG